MALFQKSKKKVSERIQRETTPAPPPPPPSKPIGEVPKSKVASLGIYEELAKELDFNPGELLTEQLIKFMEENNIPRFSYMEMTKYLTHKAEKAGKNWHWRPLRERDKPVGWQWGAPPSWNGRKYIGHDWYSDEWRCRPYDKAIPIDILRNVKKIQDKFEDKVYFFVSDYSVPQPDPFIMVTALDVPRIVFGVWDEPAFFGE